MIYFTSVKWILEERILSCEDLVDRFFTIKDKELSDEVLKYETIGYGDYITNSVDGSSIESCSLYNSKCNICDYIPKWAVNSYPYIMLMREFANK